MRPIGDILAAMADRYRWHRAELLLEVEKVWAAAVGPQIAAVTRPIGFMDGTLTVAVPSPVWTQELRYLEDELCAALNRRITGGEIHHLKLMVRPAAPPRSDGHASDREALRRLAQVSSTLHRNPSDGSH
jgi:predicted nucleic acid-binding Zn ribbon protein